jgi:hypothetical protein
MTPIERERVKRFAARRQAAGELLAWSIDEIADQATFFVPLDVNPELFPGKIGSVRIILTRLPRAKELLAWSGRR